MAPKSLGIAYPGRLQGRGGLQAKKTVFLGCYLQTQRQPVPQNIPHCSPEPPSGVLTHPYAFPFMVLASSSDTILASMVFPIADTWEGHFTDRMGRKIPLLFFIVVGYLRRNKKTSKRITRADVGIVEARFAATGGSWEPSQVNRGLLLSRAFKLQRGVNSLVPEHQSPSS